MIEGSEQEKQKNRILLSIFVVAIIGFIVLIFNRPPMKHSEVLKGISFPPSAKDLYKLSQVKLTLLRFLFSIKINILCTQSLCSCISTHFFKLLLFLDRSFFVFSHQLCLELSEDTFCACAVLALEPVFAISWVILWLNLWFWGNFLICLPNFTVWSMLTDKISYGTCFS